MRKLGVALALLLASSALAAADGIINFQYQLGGGAITQVLNQGNSKTLTSISLLPFSIQQITGSTQGFVTPPNVLDSNTLEVDNTTPTTDILHIWVTATNVTASALQTIESSFDNVGLTTGWTATLTTFYSTTQALFGGTQLQQVSFSSTSNSTDLFNTVNLGSGPVSFTAEYDINTHNLTGDANLGINLSAVPVPSPIVGAELPGLIAACGGLLALARRRRQLVA